MSSQVPAGSAAPGVSDYHFAPAVGARAVGALLVLLALLLGVATAIVAVVALPVGVLVLVALLGGAAVAGLHLATRRVPVVRFDAEGYRVRLLRGAGVPQAAWTDVAEAVASTPDGLPVVVLRLTDGRATTIPVTVLDADREQFARDLQAHLQHGHGLRRLP